MSTPVYEGFDRQADGRIRPPQMFNDESLDAAFWANGFVKVPLLSVEEMSSLRGNFAELSPTDGFDPRNLENPRCEYHCTFLDPNLEYRKQSDHLVRTAMGEQIKAVLPGYRILTSNVYVKPAGTGRFEIHQNWPTIEDIDIPTVTVWAPLQDTGFKNGTIRVVPGGHRIFPDIAAATSDRFFDDFETELIETYLEPVNVAAGEALIFDDSLLHWSSDNLSENPRITFQIEMVPQDAQTVLWIRNPEDPTQFDLWEAATDFWLEYDMESVLGRPEGLKFLGTRPNPNQHLSLAEFDARLQRADEIRRAKYVLD
ncbi:MAG: phytanoyl-CoA dioxygenase family protein [Actinobacteria bacterium]|nr:phytanoyl-CoA dioxygenase family protein [Actinomycetota bacterium]